MIDQGAPFLFKTHFSHGNLLVGFGYLSGWARLPVSQAWDFFGEDNGCSSEREMRTRIRKYRRTSDDVRDPEVGCIMLRDLRLVDPHEAPAAPPDWPTNVVQGKSYELESPQGSYVEQALRLLMAPSATLADSPSLVPGDVFGRPHLVPTRVGQRAFKALVQEAYGRRCAVTGDKIVPVLQAAHIRPVSESGENRVDNGLLLRSDVHTLFDRGYLAVHPDSKRLLVSPRLRADWGNGEEFYERARAIEPIVLPTRGADVPKREFLEWHADQRFLAS
ncbi:MAG: HNH endonuclease [Propionibacteriaceae bacterium]